MKISASLAASLIAAAVVASPLAYSAPGNGTEVTPFRSTMEAASGEMYTSNTSTSFYARAYDDYSTGVRLGDVSVGEYNYETSTFSYISCFGPAYAYVVTVSKSGGQSSINATLDPASSDCSSNNVSSPLTVNVSGQYNGGYASHNNGAGNSTDGEGTSDQFTFQLDNFQETFTGTNGFATGTFNGGAYTQHNTRLSRVK